MAQTLLDLTQITRGKGFLRVSHLLIIDGFGAGIITVWQEAFLRLSRHRFRPDRAQISIGPNRLPFVGQHVINHLFAVIRVWRVFYQADDLRNGNGPLLRDHKGDVGMVGIFRAIGIEVIIQQDWDFAGQQTRIGGLLRHNRLIG